MKLNRKKVRDMAKNKGTLIETVRKAASNLATMKYYQGQREGVMAMLEALERCYGFGHVRMQRAVNAAMKVLDGLDGNSETEKEMEGYWKQRGVFLPEEEE